MVFPGTWLWVLVLALFFPEQQALATPSVHTLANSDHVRISSDFEYRCGTGDGTSLSLDVASLPWSRSDRSVNRGYGAEICQTRFALFNPSALPIQVYLVHDFSLTDIIELQQKRPDGTWQLHGQLGSRVPHQQWPIRYHVPVFAVHLEPGLNEFHARQHSRDVSFMDWTLYTTTSFIERTQIESMMLGGFFATCLVLSLYNLIIFLVTRSALQIYYVLYLTAYALVQLSLSGVLKAYCLPHAALLDNYLGLILYCNAYFWISKFVYQFLGAKTFPRPLRWLYWFAPVSAAAIILSLGLIPYSFSAAFCLFLSGYMSFMVSLLTLQGLRMRRPAAGIFALAWASLIVGNFVQVSLLAGFVPPNLFTKSAPYLGAALEAVLISFALAHQFKKMSEVERQAREHAFSQLEKMVFPHQLASMQQGNDLESTMPIASAQACVLCVDIVGSTRLPSRELKDFLSLYFKECDLLMNKSYLPESLTAEAYRIKEMGDGFLCSVGFPFCAPGDASLESQAVRLAFGFVSIFRTTLAAGYFEQLTPPTLSIGIAKGEVEGFFTIAGTKGYDLFGRGIAVATRYEGLRKQFTLPGEGQLICISEAVFVKLTAEEQAFFRSRQLAEHERIRDDPEARVFYYARIEERGLTRNDLTIAS